MQATISKDLGLSSQGFYELQFHVKSACIFTILLEEGQFFQLYESLSGVPWLFRLCGGQSKSSLLSKAQKLSLKENFKLLNVVFTGNFWLKSLVFPQKTVFLSQKCHQNTLEIVCGNTVKVLSETKQVSGGSTGGVFRYRSQDNEDFAVKYYDLQSKGKDLVLQAFLREKEVLKGRKNNENIVKYYGSFCKKGEKHSLQFGIVMEYCKFLFGGDFLVEFLLISHFFKGLGVFGVF